MNSVFFLSGALGKAQYNIIIFYYKQKIILGVIGLRKNLGEFNGQRG